jgi:DNA-binding GntR family transcriptional regulator
LASESNEHMAIIHALLRGDRTGSVRAMAKHIASGMRYWCRAIPGHSPGKAKGRPIRQDFHEGKRS